MMHRNNQDVVWINLKILAKLPPYARLNTKNALFAIEPNNSWSTSFLWRFIRGDNRQDALKRIDDLVKSAYELHGTLEDERDRESLLDHLRGAIGGMMGMKKTYEHDVQTIASIDRLLDKVHAGLPPDTEEEESDEEVMKTKSPSGDS